MTDREQQAQVLRDTFGEKVRAELAARDWTYDDLAKAAGIPRQTVSNTINARTSIAFTGAAFIARALGKSLDELCGGNSMEPTRPTLAEDDTALACVHTRDWLPERHVCRECIASWNKWQDKLRRTIDEILVDQPRTENTP